MWEQTRRKIRLLCPSKDQNEDNSPPHGVESSPDSPYHSSPDKPMRYPTNGAEVPNTVQIKCLNGGTVDMYCGRYGRPDSIAWMSRDIGSTLRDLKINNQSNGVPTVKQPEERRQEPQHFQRQRARRFGPSPLCSRRRFPSEVKSRNGIRRPLQPIDETPRMWLNVVNSLGHKWDDNRDNNRDNNRDSNRDDNRDDNRSEYGSEDELTPNPNRNISMDENNKLSICLNIKEPTDMTKSDDKSLSLTPKIISNHKVETHLEPKRLNRIISTKANIKRVVIFNDNSSDSD